MRNLRRFGIVAAAAAAVGLVVASGPGTVAGATETPATVQDTFTRAGNIFLWTGSGAAAEYDANADGQLVQAPSGPDAVQPIVGSKSSCLITSDDSTVLGIDGYVGSGTTDKASFQVGSIGVAEKKTGTSCYQVSYSSTASASESLWLRVQGSKLVGDLGPLVAGSAYFDVELKASARILATAYRGGRVVGAYELQSGGTIGATPTVVAVSTPTATDPDATTPTSATVFTCNNPSDSGPDSGVSDNCRWPVSSPSWLGADDGVYFDALSLVPLNGYFSLEGGADGTVATTALNARPTPAQIAFPSGQGNADVVELYDVAQGTLNCNQYTQTLTADPASSTPQVQLRRLDNAGSEACVLVPYSLNHGTSNASFLKPVDLQQTAQYVANLTWYDTPSFANPPGTRTTALADTTVTYTPGMTPVALGWCPSPIIDANGTLQGIANPLDPNDPSLPGNPQVYDQDTSMTGVQFSCIGTRYATERLISGTWYVSVTEQVYVLGDISFRNG